MKYFSNEVEFFWCKFIRNLFLIQANSVQIGSAVRITFCMYGFYFSNSCKSVSYATFGIIGDTKELNPIELPSSFIVENDLKLTEFIP